MKLSDRKIKLTKPEKNDLFLSDGNGLYLRITNAGTKIWLFRYKKDKVTKWDGIGQYPKLSLAEARLIAHNQKASIREGIYPIDARNTAKIAAEKEAARIKERISVNDLYAKWMKLDVSKRKDKGAEIHRSFTKDVLPKIGHLPAEEINKRIIGEITDSILERDANRMAKVTLSLLRQMFRFAIDRDIIKSDPTATIRKSKIGTPDVERERVLSEREIKQLAKNINSSGLLITTQLAIWIPLATSCRIGELIKAKWKDVDLNNQTWEIPPRK